MDDDKNNNEIEKDEFWQQIEIFSGVSDLRSSGMQRYTNLTELYSQLPKRVYYKKGRKGIVYRDFDDGHSVVSMSITPAMIPIEKRGKDGVIERSEVIKYPALKEDRVEEALAYIAAQGGAKIKPEHYVIGVFFTLQQVRAVIKNVFNIEYSVVQVREALQILNRTVLELKFNTPQFRKSNENTRISKLTLVERAEYLHDPNAKCYCELHWAFARDIATGNYGLHDIEWQGRLETDLAQDLMKRLSVRFRHANERNSYWFMGKRALENTAFGFDTKNESRSWDRLFEALDDLKEKGVISEWEEEAKYDESRRRGRRKILDRRIEVWPTQRFIDDAKFTKWAQNHLEVNQEQTGFDDSIF